jgi:predicted enzyme related to lactoylglutathione lyase
MLKGIETVVYHAEDVKAATAWYRKVLAIEPNFEAEFYCGFTVAGDELGIQPGKPVSGGQVAYWSVDDIDKAIAHFVEHGAKSDKPPDDVGGGIRVVHVTDPFGNAFGLIQNPNSPNK